MQVEKTGIDIGNLYIKVVRISGNEIIEKKVVFHNKKILENLENILREKEGILVGFTGSFYINSIEVPFFDEVKCLIEGVKKFHRDIKYILEVGANSSKIIEVDKDFNLKNIYTNSVCAAGTGSFFDQQKDRLSLSYREIEEWEILDKEPPTIASRCTVFAKTDLINRQQEGYSKREMWAGLSKGMVKTVLNTLLRGKRIDGKVILTGGLAQNKFFVYYLKEYLKENIIVDSNSNFYQAIGAAFLTDKKIHKKSIYVIKNSLFKKEEKTEKNPTLLLELSEYPDFREIKEEIIEDVEVRIHNWKNGDKLEVYLGIDIGSTSTKCVLMRDNFDICADFYTRTRGEPINAIKKIFDVIDRVCKNKNSDISILGVGTTGSGRKLVGEFISADLVVNEITAHAKGALHFYPDAEVIFEIGGQDSKYIRLKDRKVFDCNMNYVCSAGTGSFLEEQAKKLGFDIREVSDKIMGISPPVTQERCTVFMEQDIEELLKRGFTREEAIAACTYSIVHNYLNKVVGKRYIPEGEIVFQGATARNKSLVAAFEKVCERKIVVSPFCHLMGAFGTAILTKERIQKENRPSKFKGFDIRKEKIDIWYENCNYCENNCKITYLKTGNKVVSFGYQCGREPDDTGKKRLEELKIYEEFDRTIYRFFETDKKEYKWKIYIPRMLSTHSLFPFYKCFLENLGFKVFLSRMPDKKILEKGRDMCSADFCLPVKVAYGVVGDIIDKNEYIFIPWVINHPLKEKDKYDYFCPYVQSTPGYIISSLKLRNIKSDKIISPVFDFVGSKDYLIDNIYKEFMKFGITKREIKNALTRAIEVQRKFEEKLKEKGREILNEIEKNRDKKYVILFGRPYVIFSNACNMLTPLKIANLSIDVIPWTFLSGFGEDSFYNKNMYWYFGKKIIEVAEFIKEIPNLYPVYITTFSCGPDSFVLSYLEEIFKEKPFLILEVDEHGGDAVFQTRIEAFYDVIKEHKPYRKKEYILKEYKKDGKVDLESGTIWFPSLNPEGARLFASAFRRFGYKARALPLSTDIHFRKGRRLVRGSECLPCALTIGTFFEEIKNFKDEKHILFMPTSSGPCRFGQYSILHNLILEREGKKVDILSPTSYNAYGGLPDELRKFLWKVILVFDSLLKCRNKIRPYEKIEGITEKVYKDIISYMEKKIEEGSDIYSALEKAVKEFQKIEVINLRKPLVGIVGEIYVRFDPFSNEDVIRTIEECGGEAWLSPFSEWIWYTDFTARWRAKIRKNIIEVLKSHLKHRYFKKIEHEIFEITKDIIGDRVEPEIDEILKEATKYMPESFGTEAPLTVGRTLIFKKQGAKLVVNVSPFTCMPGNITTALFNKISRDLNIPIVNMFYDGHRGENEKLKSFLRNYLNIQV